MNKFLSLLVVFGIGLIVYKEYVKSKNNIKKVKLK